MEKVTLQMKNKVEAVGEENMTTLVSSLKESLTQEESLTPRAPSTATTASNPAVTARAGVTKLTKPIKVSTWSRNMALETFKKQLDIWSEINEEIPEFMKFHDLMESLKMNKDIKDLPRYVGEYVLPVLELKQDQMIKKVLELHEIKYGRSRTEKIEECVNDILKF